MSRTIEGQLQPALKEHGFRWAMLIEIRFLLKALLAVLFSCRLFLCVLKAFMVVLFLRLMVKALMAVLLIRLSVVILKALKAVLLIRLMEEPLT